MKLRLKENPREWLKFTAAAAVFVAIVGLVSRKRGVLHMPIWAPFVPGILALCVGAIWPRTMRGPYRAVMTLSFHVGQIIGGFLLTALFVIFLTPMALLLRITGKDLLGLRKPPGETFWRPAKKVSNIDQMF
jgi:hypothetical protein